MKLDLLTMPGCSHCAHAKEILERIKPDYPDLEVVEHDVTEEPELASKYMLMSAPGIVIDDKLEFTGGVDETKLRARLSQGSD